MKTIYFLAAQLVLLLAINSTVYARLGEGVIDTEERYGVVLETEKADNNPDGVLRRYSFHGFRIVVYFINGKSASEQFSKTLGDKLEDAEIQTILSSNTLGSTWESRFKDDPKYKAWVLASKDATATCIKKDTMLVLDTKEFTEFEDKAQKEEEDKKAKEKAAHLQGF